MYVNKNLSIYFFILRCVEISKKTFDNVFKLNMILIQSRYYNIINYNIACIHFYV